MYFSYQVRQRQQRDREAMRERQSERRTQRRLREQERAEVLAAFGQPLMESQAAQMIENEELGERTNTFLEQVQENQAMHLDDVEQPPDEFNIYGHES